MEEEEQNKVIGVFRDSQDVLREYTMETWLPSILPSSFPTVSLPLSILTIEAMVRVIQSHFRSSTVTPTEEELKLVDGVEERIDEIVKELGGEVFVKLNTRSPKDAVFESKNSNVERFLMEELEQLKKTKPKEEINDNDQLILLTHAATKALKVTSGKEAMALLSYSDRVYTDLKKAIQITKETQSEDSGITLIVRKWENFPISMEFRGFVCKRKFTALAQYFHYAYFPEIKDKKEEILQKIQNLWDSIKEDIPYESYVMDFCILEEGTPKIIEINPFHFSTGAPFFSWKKGSAEREILLNGPFEFRFREDFPPPDTKSRYMTLYYEKFFERILERVEIEKEEEEDSICGVQ